MYSATSTPYRLSLIYFLTTLLISFFRFSSRVYLNKSWRSSSKISAFFGGPTLDWDSQIVVVTGGANGIGRVITETLAVMGATVVVIDKACFTPEFDDVYFYECDLAVQAEIEATVLKIQEEVGHPTILINNAGIVQGKLLTELTAQEVQQTFSVNVLAQFSLIRLLLPSMLEKKKGHIVTVSSVFGITTASQLSDYSSSKHALISLHNSLRAELRYRYKDPPIRTTLLIPGRLNTSLFSSIPKSSSPFVNFLAPTIDPIIVAKAVTAALEKEISGEIFLPRFGGWIWVLEGGPSWFREGLEWISGANEAMRSWKKSDGKKFI